MKKDYLKPEVESIVEMPAVNILDGTDIGSGADHGGDDAPRWRKSW